MDADLTCRERTTYGPLQAHDLIIGRADGMAHTCTKAPVSSVAGLEPEEERLPWIPGSVLATDRVTVLGTSTVMTMPFQLIRGTVSPSLIHLAQLSSLLSLVSSYVLLSMKITCTRSPDLLALTKQDRKGL